MAEDGSTVPDPEDQDEKPNRPVLEGVIGWVRGDVFPLRPGRNVIGRSRHCDISLRQASGYLRQPRGERDRNHDFNTVSRRHAILVLEGDRLTIEDLSTNGTFCDEMLLTDAKGYDLTKEVPLLRLGTRESFRVRRHADAGDDPDTEEEQALPKVLSQSSYDTCEPFDAPATTEQVDLSDSALDPARNAHRE